MTKLLTLALLSVLLSACEQQKDAQQPGLREAVLAKLQEDPDLKDYKLDPAKVADCVVNAITEGFPGFPGDPRREAYYQAYARMLSVKTPAEAEQVTEQYKEVFGSQQTARAAALEVTDHIISCMGEAIESQGE